MDDKIAGNLVKEALTRNCNRENEVFYYVTDNYGRKVDLGGQFPLKRSKHGILLSLAHRLLCSDLIRTLPELSTDKIKIEYNCSYYHATQIQFSRSFRLAKRMVQSGALVIRTVTF